MCAVDHCKSQRGMKGCVDLQTEVQTNNPTTHAERALVSLDSENHMEFVRCHCDMKICIENLVSATAEDCPSVEDGPEPILCKLILLIHHSYHRIRRTRQSSI